MKLCETLADAWAHVLTQEKSRPRKYILGRIWQFDAKGEPRLMDADAIQIQLGLPNFWKFL